MHDNGERGEAFVVWIHPLLGRECTGRVECVATSERVSFGNADELIAVLSRTRDSDTAADLETKKED